MPHHCQDGYRRQRNSNVATEVGLEGRKAILMVEISVVNLRQEFGPSSWEIFADILDNLDSAGFALAKIEKRSWTMEYWTPGTKQRNLLSDGIL